MLPNAYYVSCTLRFAEMLNKLGIPFVCELHTEVATKTFEVTPEHHGIQGRISQNVIYEPGLNDLTDFDAIPNLEPYVNIHPVETLRRMAIRRRVDHEPVVIQLRRGNPEPELHRGVPPVLALRDEGLAGRR